ncbi:hypothetical protein [Aestuariibaculum sediminum]|uniref:Cytochrome c domain-containing protein n=1 Tax=Aestuariibaculum sediminum TaxID=2770637 RepID=A0A8J6QF56_9FLAO|nr:hypothetical protein [Aestuariibaculum sediminum]MBD0830889.1 hypothetical protein [Aestuariibaculum sediminum]
MKSNLPLKRILLFAALTFIVSTFQYCKSSQATTVNKEATISYEKHIVPVMERSCAPCHFSESGKKKFLDTYGAVKNNIDDIIARVELPVAEKKYMPYKSKKPALTNEEINMLKQWVSEGFMK